MHDIFRFGCRGDRRNGSCAFCRSSSTRADPWSRRWNSRHSIVGHVFHHGLVYCRRGMRPALDLRSRRPSSHRKSVAFEVHPKSRYILSPACIRETSPAFGGDNDLVGRAVQTFEKPYAHHSSSAKLKAKGDARYHDENEFQIRVGRRGVCDCYRAREHATRTTRLGLWDEGIQHKPLLPG